MVADLSAILCPTPNSSEELVSSDLSNEHVDSDSVPTPLPSVSSSLPDSLQSHAKSLSHTSTNSSLIVESEVSSSYQTDAIIN